MESLQPNGNADGSNRLDSEDQKQIQSFRCADVQH